MVSYTFLKFITQSLRNDCWVDISQFDESIKILKITFQSSFMYLQHFNKFLINFHILSHHNCQTRENNEHSR